jgi:glutamine amidotransferase
MTDVHVIDYGAGNVRSVVKWLDSVGTTWKVTSSPEEIKRANRLVLPGVGHFDTAMSNLREKSVDVVLTEAMACGRVPVLGICLGMQIMARSSQEGVLQGLGWIKGDILRFSSDRPSMYPALHIGWNTIYDAETDHPIFAGISDESEFYFVHSYYLECGEHSSAIAKTKFGIEFVSVVGSEMVVGVQFHPEKSRMQGLKFLKNFLAL